MLPIQKHPLPFKNYILQKCYQSKKSPYKNTAYQKRYLLWCAISRSAPESVPLLVMSSLLLFLLLADFRAAIHLLGNLRTVFIFQGSFENSILNSKQLSFDKELKFSFNKAQYLYRNRTYRFHLKRENYFLITREPQIRLLLRKVGSTQALKDIETSVYIFGTYHRMKYK